MVTVLMVNLVKYLKRKFNSFSLRKGWKCLSAGHNVYILPGGKCNLPYYTKCVTGTYCFQKTKYYSECHPTCPESWICNETKVSINEQCGGEGYVGPTQCAEGLNCFKRDKWYSQCRNLYLNQEAYLIGESRISLRLE